MNQAPFQTPKLGSLWIPFKLGLITGMLACLVSFLVPNKYQSYARLLPVESPSAMGPMAALSTFGMADSGDNNFSDILGSYWLKEHLLTTQFEFQERSWIFGKPRLVKKTLFQIYNAKNIDRAMKKIESATTVTKDLKTKLLTYSFESKNARLSQLVVRRSLELMDQFFREKNQTRGGNKAKFTYSRLQEARAEVSRIEESFRIFMDENRNYQISQIAGIRLKGEKFESDLKTWQLMVQTLMLNNEQALLQEKNDLPFVNILDGGNLPVEKSYPNRLLWGAIAFAASAAAAWLWQNRRSSTV